MAPLVAPAQTATDTASDLSRDREDQRLADRRKSTNIRRVVFAVLIICCTVLAVASTDSSDVLAVLPYFIAAIALQFIPMVWPTDPDPFAPVALGAVLYGPELIGEALRAVQLDSVELTLLPELTPFVRVELVQRVLLLFIVSSLAQLAGYYIGIGRGTIARVFPRVAALGWNRARLYFASGVCLAAFVVAYAFFQSRVSTSVTDLTSLAEGKAVWRDDPTMTWLGRGVLLGFLPVLFLVAGVAKRPTAVRAALAVAAAGGMAFLATRLGQRGHGIFFGVSCLIIVHYVYKRFRMTALTAMAFAALLAFDIMGEWRRGDDDGYTPYTPLSARAADPEQLLASLANDRNRLSVLATVMYYIPDRQEYFLGDSYAALLAAPIPKWLWPEKEDAFKWRDTSIVGQLHGIPAPTPMHGVLYANFSWIGVVVGMFLWGMFQRGMYEWLIAAGRDRNQALLYSAMVLYLAPSSLAIAYALQYVLPLWVIIRFAAARRASPSLQPTSAVAPIAQQGSA